MKVVCFVVQAFDAVFKSLARKNVRDARLCLRAYEEAVFSGKIAEAWCTVYDAIFSFFSSCLFFQELEQRQKEKLKEKEKEKKRRAKIRKKADKERAEEEARQRKVPLAALVILCTLCSVARLSSLCSAYGRRSRATTEPPLWSLNCPLRKLFLAVPLPSVMLSMSTNKGAKSGRKLELQQDCSWLFPGSMRTHHPFVNGFTRYSTTPPHPPPRWGPPITFLPSFQFQEKGEAEAEERRKRGLAAVGHCDACGNALIEKKAFSRFDFRYCSSDCVNAHKRKLAADAADRRFNGEGGQK